MRVAETERDPVALAFESGGDPEACARTLAVLREAEVQVTIFLDGRWAEANPSLVNRIAADGHELGNHAYSHPDLTTLPDQEIAEELGRTEALAVRLTGDSTRPWFRPPFQRLDDRVRRVAAGYGFRAIVRDALDGAHYLGPPTTRSIVERSLSRAAAGAVLTYHLHSVDTATALPEIIVGLRSRGMPVGPISALPTPPRERAPLHGDFVGLDVAPGYLRMQQPAAPPQMINLLGLGADSVTPADRLLPLDDASASALLVFNGREPFSLPPSPRGRQLACLSGEAVLEVLDGEAPFCTARSTSGDSLQVPAGKGVLVRPANGRRAILLLMG